MKCAEKEGARMLWWSNAPSLDHRVDGNGEAFETRFLSSLSETLLRYYRCCHFFYFVAGLGAIPFWLWLGRRIGKHLLLAEH